MNTDPGLEFLINGEVKPLFELLNELQVNSEARSPRSSVASDKNFLVGDFEDDDRAGALRTLIFAVNEAKDTVYGNSKGIQTLSISVHRRDEDLVKEAAA